MEELEEEEEGLSPAFSQSIKLVNPFVYAVYPERHKCAYSNLLPESQIQNSEVQNKDSNNKQKC